ncbi:family 16 glycoside hydrolase [Thalassoglobus sp. JC818]|uniref:family 16 glycoside hydrolase n=1 Tax=Thalassoglobus sp. JC818 TaxID=3232136 RepID=UPI0034588C57
MSRRFCACVLLLTVLFVSPAEAQQSDLLSSADNLELVNVESKMVEYQGKRAVNLNGTQQQGAPDIRGNRPRQAGERAGAGGRGARAESLAILKGIEFTNGTIEVELAGRPNQNAGDNARGFIGIAFHVNKSDPIAYDCFYLRPTNGRADDQLRRNHSCQYMSHPEFPFNVLRRDFPGVYESYVDLAPAEWTQVKIVVDGEKAQLYVNGAEQPCLIVNDLKRAGKTGAIALWMEQSTEAYFRNLVVSEN